MVRPRLVEEGTPLTGSSNDYTHEDDDGGSSGGGDGNDDDNDNDDGDHSMNMRDGSSSSSPMLRTIPIPTRLVPSLVPPASLSSASAFSSSSLARALSRKEDGGGNYSMASGSTNPGLSFYPQPHPRTTGEATRRTSYRTVIGCHQEDGKNRHYEDPISRSNPPDWFSGRAASNYHPQHQDHLDRSGERRFRSSSNKPLHSSSAADRPRQHRTHFEIGKMEVDDDDDDDDDEGERRHHHHQEVDYDGLEDERRGRHGHQATSMSRMEGVEDHSVPPPLVVIDGANVAHEYASSAAVPQADARGLLVASEYFAGLGLRVKVVLPASWFRRKPSEGDPDRSNAAMHTEQTDAIDELKKRGLLVPIPPSDDDDAYALALARRQAVRVSSSSYKGFQQLGSTSSEAFPFHLGGAFVVSNDWFRDAQRRDPTLGPWLERGQLVFDGSGGGSSSNNENAARMSSSSPSSFCPGRISYAFADLGTMDDRGESLLDFVPNPRHPLVAWSERRHLELHQRATVAGVPP